MIFEICFSSKWLWQKFCVLYISHSDKFSGFFLCQTLNTRWRCLPLTLQWCFSGVWLNFLIVFFHRLWRYLAVSGRLSCRPQCFGKISHTPEKHHCVCVCVCVKLVWRHLMNIYFNYTPQNIWKEHGLIWMTNNNQSFSGLAAYMSFGLC